MTARAPQHCVAAEAKMNQREQRMQFTLDGTLVETRALVALDADTWDELFRFARVWTAMDEEGFRMSLAGKHDVVIFRDPLRRRVVGCGSVGFADVFHGTQRRHVFFVGDTVFDPSIRGRALAQRVGLRYWLRAKAADPGTPLSSAGGMMTVSSYLMNARYFPQHWPAPDQELTAEQRAFLLDVGRRFYGDAWVNGDGYVLAQATKRPERGVGEVPEHLARRADVAFYLRQNPSWREGTVLVHSVPLDASNWAGAVRNIARRSVASRLPRSAMRWVAAP